MTPKKTTAAPSPESPATNQEASLINQELYKRNAELAYRNKTLSLLRKIYSITLATLDQKELAQQIVQAIREDLNFELVSLFVVADDWQKLLPLASAPADRLKQVLDEEGHVFHDDNISLANNKNICVRALETKQPQQTREFYKVWDPQQLQAVHRRIQERSNIKSILVYPLVTEAKDLGILVIALNRPFDELTHYEQEILESFTSVISIALDKSAVYEQLRSTNDDLKATTQQLASANAELRKLDEAKSEFLSIASHQLLTPLTPIQGFASMLEEGDYGELNPKQLDAIEKMRLSAVRLVRLVDDLLNISRIESGRAHYEFKDERLESVVAPLVEELQIKAQQKKVKLSYVAPKKPTTQLSIDDEKIRNVLMNIIDNSLKYAAGTESAVAVEEKNGKVLFSVKDKGMGIAADEIPHLFKKFSRGSDATKIHTEGSGLGLYVAKQFVEAHHGRIWVESSGKGKGAEFYVELPISPGQGQGGPVSPVLSVETGST